MRSVACEREVLLRAGGPGGLRSRRGGEEVEVAAAGEGGLFVEALEGAEVVGVGVEAEGGGGGEAHVRRDGGRESEEERRVKHRG